MPKIEYVAADYDYGSYETMFTVDETLDDLLAKFIHTDFATYGFKKIESYPDSPIDVSTILTPGNYSIDNWHGGPDALISLTPVNICVFKSDNLLIQVIPYMLDHYSRYAIINDDGTCGEFSTWTCSMIDNIPLYSGTTEPIVTEPALWVNTTIKDFPVFYLYNPVSGWVGIGSMIDALSALVYDINKKQTDIFRYFEIKYGIPIEGVVTPADEVTFYNLRSKFLHHKEVLGHITEEERQMFRSMLSVPEVQEYVDRCKAELIDYVDERIAMMHHKILHEVLERDIADFNDHYASPNHSSDEMKTYWNAKSDSDHEHNFDDKIIITASDILDGTLSIDLMPPEAVHVLINKLTHEERFALTKNDVQNGDSVAVLEETDIYESGYYMVYDDTKLDSDDGWIYYRTRRFANIDYIDIIRRPTTLDGYGITDGSLVIETILDNGLFDFVYPYMTEDNSVNYAITKAIIKYNDHITDILDAIEEAMRAEDIDGIWALAKMNYAEYESIDKQWKPYRFARTTLDEIIEIYEKTEDLYSEAHDILY